MSIVSTGKGFAVQFHDLIKWDYLSLSVLRFSNVRTKLLKVSDLFTVRKQVVSNEDLKTGAVKMVKKVTFAGEVILGRERTNMTQYLALPGDILVSKIRARQGSVGFVSDDHGPVSTTIHYRVLTPKAGINVEYAWHAFRSSFARRQFLAATGGAAKGEISEAALLDVELPIHIPSVQTDILKHWHRFEKAKLEAQAGLSAPVKDLEKRLRAIYFKESKSDVIQSRFFALDFKNLDAWDVKSGRASAFRLACPNFRPMGEFIREATEMVRPSDDPEKEWPVYGVNNKGGVFLNSYKKGDTFNSPYKRIQKDWFFHNPTRCNVGSLGKVPEVPENAITSPEYQVWRIQKGAPKPMLSGFVAVLIQTPFFLDLVQFNRVGAVKQRMYTENLCQLRIPYLPVDEQRKFADAHSKAAAQFEDARKRLDEVRQEVEEMIIGTRCIAT